MIKKFKELNDKKVDTKQKLNLTVLTLLILLFPLNQQYHFRPFPSVDGFIIDYLITKVSVVEILLFLILVINFKEYVGLLKTFIRSWVFWTLLALALQSVLRSNYLYLAIYENLVLLLTILTGIFLFKNLNKLDVPVLSRSIKSWIIFLTVLGLFQFINQKSLFDNYSLTGEFPYSQDNYHIKQKGFIFDDLIPPYAIFSHSNIFGAFLIVLLIFLRILNKDTWYFYPLILFNLLIIGSIACLFAFFIYLLSLFLNSNQVKKSIFIILFSSLAIYFLNSFKHEAFIQDPSIYRRLYMFDLSSSYFIENPDILLFGSGYFNYFSFVKDDLYNYELIRFFQPPHFSMFLLIWNYGVIFLSIFFCILFKTFQLKNIWFLRIVLIYLIFSIFDHYLVSNHQFKILTMLIIPYSLKYKNSI